jgi:hypothetical protein
VKLYCIFPLRNLFIARSICLALGLGDLTVGLVVNYLSLCLDLRLLKSSSRLSDVYCFHRKHMTTLLYTFRRVSMVVSGRASQC